MESNQEAALIMSKMSKMSRCKGFKRLILVVLSFAFFVQSRGGEFEFPYPANRVEWVDSLGKLSIWVNGNWNVDLGDGERLPLRFKFSSMQNRVTDGVMGVGWWVPLLESTVRHVSDNSIRVTTLGGQSLFMVVAGGGGDASKRFHTSDGAWNGVIVGDRGEFRLSGPGGWEFFYRKGWLEKVKSPSGAGLTWNYSSPGRLESISEGNRVLVDVEYEEEGLLKNISMNGQRLFEFESGSYPKVGVDGNAIVALEPYVNRIAEITDGVVLGRKFTFDLSLDRALGRYTMGYSHDEILRVPPEIMKFVDANKASRKGDEGERFVWDVQTGELRGDSENDYWTENVSGVGGRDLVKTVKRNRSDRGMVDSHYFDGRGMMEEVVRGGLKTKTVFIGTPGLTYGKVREREKFNESGEVAELVSYAYDLKGRLLRRVEKDYVGGEVEAEIEKYIYLSSDEFDELKGEGGWLDLPKPTAKTPTRVKAFMPDGNLYQINSWDGGDLSAATLFSEKGEVLKMFGSSGYETTFGSGEMLFRKKLAGFPLSGKD